MDKCKNKCINCLFKSDVVSVLDVTELELLNENCFTLKYKKGELILKEGTPVQNIIYLRSGYVKCIKLGSGEQDFILNISKPGSYLGIQNITRKFETNFFSAIAISDVEVCHINIECFYALLKTNGTFAIEVLSAIFNDEMKYFERLVNSVQKQLPGRLASTLIYFKDHIYYKSKFDLNLTRSELSSLVGASRESVSRILNEFKASGLIEVEGSIIEIKDEKRLLKIKDKG